ncbi:pyrimidine reductase family protein [Corynebacterium faecale]|uniref:pyrimidine reductase family protein n=1 Tax=Corynebacterium faecale TaxID=1758466 RepID=UPI0025B327EC|nr:pyrimidine reductase family protein [Corynebacterium faecale]
MAHIDDLIGPVLPVATPEFRVVLVTSIVGSTAAGGTSGRMGNETDTALLLGLRQWSDVVLVGSSTIKAEDYGGVMVSESDQHKRRARGQEPVPPIAVISSSLDFDPTAQFFRSPTPPIIITDSTDQDKLGVLEDAGARLMRLDHLGVGAIVDKLNDEGFARISCEGGAFVYAQAVEADVVDVWHQTIDPTVSGSVEKPAVRGGSTAATRMRLEHTHVDPDSTLFLRYRRS